MVLEQLPRGNVNIVIVTTVFWTFPFIKNWYQIKKTNLYCKSNDWFMYGTNYYWMGFPGDFRF